MAPLPITGVRKAVPVPLVDAHFQGDRSRRISEADLKRVLAAPVFIEDAARVGVLPVRSGYAPENGLPVVNAPGLLTTKLEETGAFDVVTEVSTDWPMERGIAGLRELATRYRSEYLLLYRHRFIDQRHTNGWGLAYVTLVGALFVPSRTIRTAGVLEATLFDVKSGTILFTAYERVRGRMDANVWQNDRKSRDMQQALLGKAADSLGNKVIEKVRELSAAKAKMATHAALDNRS